MDSLRYALILLVLTLLLPWPASGAEKAPAIAGMKAGRAVWLGSCELCHANPESGAPQIGDRKAWAVRLQKGVPALYQSALQGFKASSGSEMPPRGANPSLTDADVRAALDYMVAASSP